MPNLDILRCTGCTACAVSCRTKCITMTENTEGFLEPRIDMSSCVECGLCEKVCPLNKPLAEEKPIKAYAVKSKSEQTIMDSSSGGLFSEMANAVLSKNGVVFGAKYDENFKVVHGYTENVQDLKNFRGSKYVQSELGDTFKEVEAFLKNDRLVLFCGTPCQAAGLKSFLRKEYENLILVDFICHGVPSPKVWQEYFDIKADKKHLDKISFRDKTRGWNSYSLSFTYANGKKICESRYINKYLRGFNSNMFLRGSCHDCHFKTVNRVSDVTIADFWGVERVLPQFADKNGVSLAFLQTDKGQAFFGSIQNIAFVEADAKKAADLNKSMTVSAVPNKNRNSFFSDLDTHKIKFVMNKYCTISPKERAILIIRTLYRKLKKR